MNALALAAAPTPVLAAAPTLPAGPALATVAQLPVVSALTTEPPLQAVSAVQGASRPVRAAGVFALVAVVGGALCWRAEPFLAHARKASVDRPLSALGYGLATHAVIAFGGVYLANKLARFAPLGEGSGVVGLWFGLSLVAVAAAIGFTVVGVTATDLLGEDGPWPGLLAGAVVAAGTTVVAPTVGAVAWFALVSVGIGGAVREWLHASAVEEIRAEEAS